MKNNHYIVTFTNERTVFVSAFNENEALILAQATMIKAALSYDLKSIVKTTNISDMADTNYIA